jgi:hypothetical protein
MNDTSIERIEIPSDGSEAVPFTGWPSAGRIAAMLVVAMAGLGVGAFVGLIVCLMTGLIQFSC